MSLLQTDTIIAYLHPTKGWRKGHNRMTKRIPAALRVKRIDGTVKDLYLNTGKEPK